MTLRDSKFKGNATYDNISEMAQGALGKDEHGYRKEFLDLIQKAKQADVRLTAGK